MVAFVNHIRHHTLMTIREEKNQAWWDKQLINVPHTPFLQSWAWGDAQASLGKRVIRFIVEEKGGIVFLAQAYQELRHGFSYWFIPGGPVSLVQNVPIEDWQKAVDLVAGILLKGRALFLRIEPHIRLNSPADQPASPPSWTPTASFNPAIHWMVPLRYLRGTSDLKTEEQILSEMQQKTRYNLRLGERHGVTSRLSIEDRDFDTFLSLMHETATRDQFVARDDGYLHKTFFTMADAGIAKMRLAEYEGQTLAASIEVSFGDTVTYLHGASSSSARDLKAPNVLQWHAIRDALRNGFCWYDFGGANPIDPSHRLYKKSLEGVTRFKEGWGGERIEFVGTFALPRFKFLKRWLQ